MPLLPVPIESVSNVVILAVGIHLVALHTSLASHAAPLAGLGARARALAPVVVGAFLSSWLATAMVVATHNHAAPKLLLRDPLMAAVAFGPVILAGLALAGSKAVRAINSATPSEWLIRAQMYRGLGVIFLYPYLFYGVIPAGFAIPAAIGDTVTGLAAPWVARQIHSRRPGAVLLAIGWNVFGILDLVVAPVSAVLSHAQGIFIYPLTLIPLFIGPPMGVLVHVYSLRNLANGFALRRVPHPELG